jgi:hypothetical protein
MRTIFVATLTLALSAPMALADNAPLAPGKPAGVRQAQWDDGSGMFVVAGAALVGIAIALATAGNPSQPNNTNGQTGTSTSATGTSP